MSLVRSGPSTQPPGDVSVTRYLARGAAADIWVVSSEQLSKRVYKTLRISPERLIRNHLDDSIGLQSSENLWTSFLEEFSAVVRTWLSLDHRNVVRIFGISDETSLEVDYYGGGCVRDYLKAHSSTVDKAAMFSDVLAGMKHLHRNDPPIVHGNVNAGKLFVDHTGKTVVGEFGLTALCYPFAAYAPSISFDGLTRWFSPELFDDDTDQIPQPTLASDIWALGCTLYEVLTFTVIP
ncbi:hypothetical protein FRC09_002326 [Ceratobasidium sp. 395]|nr:hypothetical protein FRC09_002326 [Ceratobasidium sp. 395]